MALRTILQEPNERLRKRSKEVKEITPKIKALLDDMIETLASVRGYGLAAPQVGVLKRVVFIDAGDGPLELINPVIIEKSGEQREEEGCLSCDTRRGMVVRPMRVVCEALDREGNKRKIEAEGLLARAICHECDHLDGQLFIDIMDEELFDDEYDDEYEDE